MNVGGGYDLGNLSSSSHLVQNLLRTLTENQVKATPDLKLLLNTVKDARRQGYDIKVSEPFYESLEGLLHDVRTVTMDNHDAEAFLKPVLKSDYPDYYDGALSYHCFHSAALLTRDVCSLCVTVVSNPMDFQTMLKKVKAKQYKSKREFKDDLDLIWSNCYTYNATEDHPLRLSARRLKKKADKLLANITDRKDRVDPSIPADLSLSSTARPVTRPKINGYASHDRIKPHYHSHSNSISGSRPSSANGVRPAPGIAVKKMRRDVPFGETPALVRTPEGMAAFRSLDIDLEGLGEPGPSTLAHSNGYSNHGVVERLRGYTTMPEWESESEEEQALSGIKLENDVGDKRKLLNGIPHRPRKRTRLTPPDSDDDATRERHREATELWWSAVQSDALLANGLPCLPRYPPPSKSGRPSLQVKVETSPSKSLKRKRLKPNSKAPTAPPNTLLALMSSNVKTLKRVRRTHAKFAALNLNAEDGGGMGMDEPPETAEEDPVDEFVDERPWKVRAGLRDMDMESGIELGGETAVDCLRWTNGKVLEHAGFQGTSAAALDVMTGVTSEFFLNVGRTLRFLCDKYARTMTPEEIILHTLFESGITKIQDLERYIKDDVVRHGARLADLEKKLVSAYREATSVDVLDDDALFGAGSEDEESESAFAMGLGGFSDALSEDFLGLKELGIAAEFGLSSLSIPKRLLKAKQGGGSGAAQAKPTEPPPPYPPPPPFIPITSKNVEDQIGLLKPYYHERLAALAPSMPAPIPGMPPIPSAFGVPMPGMGPMGIPGQVSGQILIVALPDDSPLSSQVKLGPIGQVIKSGQSGGVKKKARATGSLSKDVGGANGLPPGLLTLKPEDGIPVEPMTMFDGGTYGIGGSNTGGEWGVVKRSGSRPLLPGSGVGSNGNHAAQKKTMDLPPVIVANA
ncbi:hypothetical protein PAXRUDRAFT_26504 [Paxillus rubicundulus Ve08.2h10]|uniref:Bromo domain-containing protein n=1 Tax=Paxillus rubicundulus Ve08.2h10 TaxID=930991 RepID=A0A0D0E045_9AGAM|nr:hypothetical protein PAXRUDRAFT_26504 [Paxillus rubicundulus Ve08.2h10]